jgi:hypothetical protein
MFYEVQFDEDSSLEGGVYRFSRASLRFKKSCLTRAVRLKAVSVDFQAHHRASCLTRAACLKAFFVIFRAHYRAL